MFDRLRSAAQWGRLETRLRRALGEAGVAEDARIRRSAAAEDLVIVTLGDLGSTTVDLEKLEASLVEICAEPGMRVELVRSGHGHAAGKTQEPAPARPGGHDNPLGLMGSGPPKAKGPKDRERVRPDGVARVLVVASGKGGVGKSTVASLIARALHARGHRTGLLDLDIYGPSVPLLFEKEGARATQAEGGGMAPLVVDGISLMSIGFLVTEEKALAWRGPMVMGAAKQLLGEVAWDGLDWLVIDTPPGTGDAHLSLLQRTIIDATVLVSTPSPLALADLRRGAALFGKLSAPVLGLVENMAATDGYPSPFGPPLPQERLEELGLERLATLPLDPKLAALSGTDEVTVPGELDDLARRISELDPAGDRR